MDDLISRQAAIDAIENAFDRETILNRFVMKIAISAVRTLPSAQPELQNIIDIAKVTMAMAEKADLVAVTRCKDCKHYHPYYCEMWSKYGTIQTQPDDYCSRAERRTDE